MKKNDIDKIKIQYINSAKEHRRASFSGDFKIANKEYKKLRKIFNDIQVNIIDRKFLIELLNGEELEVATWAAVHMLGLKFETKRAVKLLDNVARNDDLGMLSFNAKMTLKVWKEKGELTF